LTGLHATETRRADQRGVAIGAATWTTSLRAETDFNPDWLAVKKLRIIDDSPEAQPIFTDPGFSTALPQRQKRQSCHLEMPA